MKILFVGNHQSVFIKELTLRLKQKRPDYDIHLLSLCQQETLQEYYQSKGVNLFFQKKFWPDFLYRIPKVRALLSLFDILKILRSDTYDICNLHFASWYLGFIAQYLVSCCSKFVITVWGSDFYHPDKFQQIIQNNLFKKASSVTATNIDTLDRVKKRFQLGPQVKTEIIRFGLAPLEEMRKYSGMPKDYFKKLLNFPPDCIVITCGYHGRENHQHLRIIESIASVREQLPGNIFLLFPMTYGLTTSYKKKIQEELENLKLPYKILDYFLSDEEVAWLRFATDILINVPISDQLSGSMQEHLFAGSKVITGDWLPYGTLYESGISILKVSNLNEVGPILLHAIREIDEKKLKYDYTRIIWNLSSWETNIDKWINFYEKIIC